MKGITGHSSLNHTPLASRAVHASDEDERDDAPKASSGMKVAELRNELRKLNQSVRGSKEELIQRIASVRASGAAVGAKQKREGFVLKEGEGSLKRKKRKSHAAWKRKKRKASAARAPPSPTTSPATLPMSPATLPMSATAAATPAAPSALVTKAPAAAPAATGGAAAAAPAAAVTPQGLSWPQDVPDTKAAIAGMERDIEHKLGAELKASLTGLAQHEASAAAAGRQSRLVGLGSDAQAAKAAGAEPVKAVAAHHVTVPAAPQVTAVTAVRPKVEEGSEAKAYKTAFETAFKDAFSAVFGRQRRARERRARGEVVEPGFPYPTTVASAPSAGEEAREEARTAMQEAYARKMATLSASVHKPLGAPGVKGKEKGPNTWAALAPDDYVPFDQVSYHDKKTPG